MKRIKNKFALFSMLSILFACTPETRCDISLYVNEYEDMTPLKFDRKVWSQPVTDTILLIREKMVCDLFHNVLNKSMPYPTVKILLGDGVDSKPMNVHTDSSLGTIELEKEVQKKNILLYQVGYSSSGTNYLFIEFRGGFYWSCFRGEAM